MISRRFFLLTSGTLSISQGWKLDDRQLKDFPKLHECELYLEQSLTPPQCKIIGAYHTSNHRLAIEIGQWSTFLISSNNRLCHFYSCNVVENEAHFVLECPLYNSIRYKFQALFEKLVLGSLKSFFQLDHQVDISLYLTEATASATLPSSCTFSLIKHYNFLYSKVPISNSFHWA